MYYAALILTTQSCIVQLILHAQDQQESSTRMLGYLTQPIIIVCSALFLLMKASKQLNRQFNTLQESCLTTNMKYCTHSAMHLQVDVCISKPQLVLVINVKVGPELLQSQVGFRIIYELNRDMSLLGNPQEMKITFLRLNKRMIQNSAE